MSFFIMIGYYKGASGELQSFLYCEWYSIPLADVTIMMGDTQMPGIIGKDNNEGSQYVANETEFRGFS